MIPLRAAARFAAVAALLLGTSAAATPLSPDEIAKLCAEADGPAHCGRLIEAEQLKRLPNLAVRDGNTLLVRLYPSGQTRLTDVDGAGGMSYALFDFMSELNAVVLWTTVDDESGFLLLQRLSGQQTRLPSAPVASPDRTRFATADFCAARCENLLTVWRASRDDVRRELTWKPAERWTDASVEWKDRDTLVVEFTRAGDERPQRVERRMADASWTRVDAR